MTDPRHVNRRSFLLWSGALAGVSTLGGVSLGEWASRPAGSLLVPVADAKHGVAHAAGLEQVFLTSCATNCGGRCVLRAHVTDGVITRIETDPDPDLAESPQLRACLRGRSYRQIEYHPDRLKYPLKRTGPRGSGEFTRISWDEATTTIADQIRRVNEQYGPMALYQQYASGIQGINRGDMWARRLFGVYAGDFLNRYGSYSSGQSSYATPYTYGTASSGSMRQDWVNSKLLLLMGFNPAETVFGTNTMYYLRQAKEAGARIIVVDPRYTDTAVAVGDEWIPIRPSTDSALMDGMAHTIITDGLVDQSFVDSYAIGFDEQHMPNGVPAGNSYKSYILGEPDGQPKTPEWAATITGIPADRIRQLGREFGTTKPAALIQGNGPQRHSNGDQTARSATVLASITGNVGVKGGWASGAGSPFNGGVTLGSVPVKGGAVQISCFMWTDAIVRGTEMTAKDDLVVGADRLTSNIKLILNLGGNTLINQHSDAGRTTRILQDETKCEFIATSDLFMTPSARWSDIVLPAASSFERENVITPWSFGEYLIYQKAIVQPPFETRNEYEWLTDVADKLGVKDAFTEGRTAIDWMRYVTDATAKAHPDFPGFDAFRENGVFKTTLKGTQVAFEAFRADPVANKLKTPSGKIEIFSKTLYDRGAAATNPDRTLDVVPAIPKYVAGFEGPSDPKRAWYPLQLSGYHTKRRVHSSHDNNPWMTEVEPTALWMNPIDAEVRSIHDGDQVRVFNDRGASLVPAHVTQRVMPGVVSLGQGAWFIPNNNGVDTHGSINTLTTQRGSYMSNSNPQHTNLVQVQAAQV